MTILLKGSNTLAERFTDIDAKEVLKEEQENKARFGKYPRNIRRLFKLDNLPEILMEAA